MCRQLELGSAVEGGLWSDLAESTPTPAADTVEQSSEDKKEETIGIVKVECTDSTSSIANCTVLKVDNNECNHTSDAGVVCSETSKNGKFTYF